MMRSAMTATRLVALPAVASPFFVTECAPFLLSIANNKLYKCFSFNCRVYEDC